METKDTTKQTNYIGSTIALLCCIFSCIYIFTNSNESQAYNTKELLVANEAFTQQKYEKALQIIKGDKAEDYYNRATIQTLAAYTYGLQSNISGLETAQIYIDQAQKNFEIAKKLTTSKSITTAIATNQKTITKLATVIDIKTCYGIGQETLTNMTNIVDTLQDIQTTLDIEAKTITETKKNLESICYQKLENIANTSKQQTQALEKQMQNNKKAYISDFSNKKENPLLCRESPYDNTIPFIEKGKKGLELYEQQHQSTIEILKSKDKQRIQQLCNQTKNDAQINQEITDSVEEMLQKIEERKEAKSTTNQTVEYKNFLQENEKKALQEIKSTNELWINNIMNNKGKEDYSPQREIKNLFNQFYGNSGEFIDIHK